MTMGRFRPKDRVERSPAANGRTPWLINGAIILTYKSWDDPPSSDSNDPLIQPNVGKYTINLLSLCDKGSVSHIRRVLSMEASSPIQNSSFEVCDDLLISLFTTGCPVGS